ncbi:MAG: rhomboid family intramembrane serine protease [Candidatus Bathyarchaeia archaeon]
MIYLWVFGNNVEDALGHIKYLAFYLIGGIFASLVHICSTLLSLYLKPVPYMISDLRIPAVGASGAISAVLGTYSLCTQTRKKTLIFYFFIITVVSVPAYYYLSFWFIYQILMGVISLTGISSGVAFWAHIGGFAFGMMIAKTLSIKSRKKVFGKRRIYNFPAK